MFWRRAQAELSRFTDSIHKQLGMSRPTRVSDLKATAKGRAPGRRRPWSGPLSVGEVNSCILCYLIGCVTVILFMMYPSPDPELSLAEQIRAAEEQVLLLAKLLAGNGAFLGAAVLIQKLWAFKVFQGYFLRSILPPEAWSIVRPVREPTPQERAEMGNNILVRITPRR